MSLDKAILERIEKLERKYQSGGQDMQSYLDGLIYSNSLTYWDYIHLDTLLSIQNTRTDFHDEKIFIVYHQITELYFNLILHELNATCNHPPSTKEGWIKPLSRMVRYFECLIQSFQVMSQGMDKEEFLKFRMSLLPSSGFQSVQFRKIELSCTHLKNLCTDEKPSGDVLSLYQDIYWKKSNRSLSTGEKTLSLTQFEQRYDDELLQLAISRVDNNLCALKEAMSDELKACDELNDWFAQLDTIANKEWPRQHMKAAVHHLDKKPEAIKATGGTNWQQYLPTKLKVIEFF